ncbi:fas-binding factor 1 homolog [Pectinophora gossypiella]|uniref:fas-binding factor 1 homolog n=1 Tax=Pectinophora gossypiella TaxID=13191 RepID=UPI00214EDBF1|nr:fas-binding factor 1 homolog [Pectinophora gossypiella]
MSFNIDDPLAGILSDGSDDSFFDDDILGKKKPAKKKTTPTAEKKNALFDLGDGDKSKTVSTEDRKDSLFDLGIAASKKISGVEDEKLPVDIRSPGPFKRSVSKESIKFPAETKSKSLLDKLDTAKSPAKSKVSGSTDRLDILSDLMDTKKEPVKPLERGKSSQSLLDDILGGPPPKTSSSQATRPTTAAKSDFDLDSFIGKSESRQTVVSSSTKPAQKKTKVDPPKEDTKKTKSSEDWLGIFQNKDMENEEDDDANMPAWLVGDTKKKKPDNSKKSIEPPSKETTKVEREIEAAAVPSKSEDQIANEQTAKVTLSMPSLPAMPTIGTPALPSVLQGSNEDITAEGAALYLGQQESQLMLALQLKAQEEKLVAMQMRQKETHRIQREATLAQHAQVDAILQRQAEQRRQMQAIIATHQERITQRIKELLGTSTTNLNSEDQVDTPEDGQDYTPTERRESPHTKEKKQLLQLVQSLQENHDKEIDLMETSYRRQLAFLEVSVNQSEERMKEESDKLVKFYTEKINWLDEHHQLYKKMTEENLLSLTERHKTENEMLRQQHLENIKVLQEHHAALMENIKNAVKQEQVLIQDSAGFSADLQELVTDVKESKSQCQLLVEKVQKLAEHTQRDTERSLQARESQVNDMIQHLKRERENFETEKAESRDMVKMLETRLKQMTAMIEEETAALKQKKMEFEFDRATFGKQTEFAKNVLKKQDDEIKMLKEDIQREYQEKIAKIDEEKAKALKDSAAIAKEKASIQNLKQELEKTKAELQAQLEEVSEERSRLNLEKQQMHMEEQRILAKSRDLDLLAKTAIEKQTQADKKHSEAEFIQKKYEDRIRRMQEHVVSLNAREKQIAKEKVALSRERLSLHNERKQMESRQHCSLCKPPQNVPSYNFEPNFTLPETFLNVPVSRDYIGTSANYAMNAIEQEMANLIGRNFGLRHSTGVGNVAHEDKYVQDRDTIGDNFQQTTQMESGVFKDYMDPKFMMLRLDVQQVLSNLDQTKKEDEDKDDQQSEKD